MGGESRRRFSVGTFRIAAKETTKLVSKKAGFPMTHDLLLLNKLCSDAGVFVEIAPKLLNILSDFAVRTRYPGEEPTLRDAKEAMEITKSIRGFARKFLGL